MQLNGIALSLISSFAFAMIAWLIPFMNGGFSPTQLLFGRSVFSLVILFPFVYKELLKSNWSALKLHILRGIAGGGAVLIYFSNVASIGPSLAASIVSFSSVFSLLIGIVINGEKLNRLQLVGVLICNFGIFLMANGIDAVRMHHILLGLTGAFLAALSVNFARLARTQQVSSNSIYYSFTIVTLFISAPFMSSIPKISTAEQLIAVALMAFFGWLAQFTVTGAYHALGNAKASALGRLIVGWAFLLEVLTNKSNYSNLKLAVCILTAAGGVLIVLGGMKQTSKSSLLPKNNDFSKQ